MDIFLSWSNQSEVQELISMVKRSSLASSCGIRMCDSCAAKPHLALGGDQRKELTVARELENRSFLLCPELLDQNESKTHTTS